MKVVIRADASVDIGSGHIMRCLTLASGLSGSGAEVSFISRELAGNMCDLIEAKGFKVYRLPEPQGEFKASGTGLYEKWLGVDKNEDAKDTIEALSKGPRPDWLIIDHYAIDIVWEKALRPFVRAVMVLDDLADRRHDCDILLDQNLSDKPQERYDGLVSEGCRMLLGPRFMLLRPEFIEARKKTRTRTGRIERVLVFFGGSDPTDETTKTLRALNDPVFKDIKIDVVVGGSNARKDDIEAIGALMANVSFYCQTDAMCDLMSKADLAIGACGTTAWERCSLGLPAIVIVTAENQAEIAANLEKIGAIVSLGRSEYAGEGDISKKLLELMRSPERLKALSRSAWQITDGSGKEAVIKVMADNVFLKD